MAQNSGGSNSGGSPRGMGGKPGVGGSAMGGMGGAAMGGNLGMGGASGGLGGTVNGLGGTSMGGAAMGGTSTGGAAMGCTSTGGVAGTVALSSGLIGYWKLDEANTTGMVMDSSGMNNHGTYMTAPTRSTAVPPALDGKSSACLTFNGTNSQVVLPAVSAYATWTAATSYSISVWVSAAVLNNTWFGTIANESTPSYCGLYVSDGNNFAYEASDTTGGSVAASTMANVWHHVVIAQDASNNLQRLYIDGVASANSRQAQDCSNTPPVPFRFGSADGVGGFFSGSIDDVRFYNRALNQAEISALACGQQ